MAQLFTGGTNPDSIQRLVVQSDRKADKIRSEGIEQLKGMQDVYQHHVNESTQIINALKEKASTEDKYRREAFQFDVKANKYYNNAVVRNLEQEVENTKTKGENEQRAIQAIAAIVPASAEIYQTTRELQKQRIEKRGQAVIDVLPPDEDDVKKQSTFDRIIEAGDTTEEREALWEKNAAHFQAQGITKDDLDRFFNADGFRRAVLQEKFARTDADGLSLESIENLPIKRSDGTERRLSFYYSKGSAEEFANDKALILNELAKQFVGDKENDKEGPYNRGLFNKFIKPRIDQHIANVSLKVGRRLNKAANERDIRTRNTALVNVIKKGSTADTGGSYSDARAGLTAGYEHYINNWKKNNPKGTLDLKTLTANWVDTIENLAKLGEFGQGNNADMLESLRQFIPAKGWNGRQGQSKQGSRKPLYKQFPVLGDSLKATRDEIIASDKKDLDVEMQEVKNDKKRDELEIRDILSDPNFKGTREELQAIKERYAGRPEAQKLIGAIENSSLNAIQSKYLAEDLSLQATMGTLDNRDILFNPGLTIADKLKLIGTNGASKLTQPDASIKTRLFNQNKEALKSLLGKEGVPLHEEGFKIALKTNQMIMQWHKDYQEGMVLHNNDQGKAQEYAQEQFNKEVLRENGNYTVDSSTPSDIKWKWSKANFAKDPGIVQEMRAALTSSGNNRSSILTILRTTDILSSDNLEEFGLNLNSPEGAKPTELAYRLAKGMSGRAGSVSAWELMVPQYNKYLAENPERAKKLGLQPIQDDVLRAHRVLDRINKNTKMGYLNTDYGETDPIKQDLFGKAFYNLIKKESDPTFNVWQNQGTWEGPVAAQYFSNQLNTWSNLTYEQQQRVYQYYLSQGNDVSHLLKDMKPEEVAE